MFPLKKTILIIMRPQVGMTMSMCLLLALLLETQFMNLEEIRDIELRLILVMIFLPHFLLRILVLIP